MFLFKTVKMNLTNSQRKSHHNFWTNQNTYWLFQQTLFHQIKSKMAANNRNNMHLSPEALSTLLPLNQCKP